MLVNFEMILSPVEILKKAVDKGKVTDVSIDRECSDLTNICRLYSTNATIKYHYYQDPLRYCR